MGTSWMARSVKLPYVISMYLSYSLERATIWNVFCDAAYSLGISFCETSFHVVYRFCVLFFYFLFCGDMRLQRGKGFYASANTSQITLSTFTLGCEISIMRNRIALSSSAVRYFLSQQRLGSLVQFNLWHACRTFVKAYAFVTLFDRWHCATSQARLPLQA